MIDKKQVMYDIERCICNVPDACRDCSKYRKDSLSSVICVDELLKDSLELLKEQEAIAPIPPTDESDLWKCGNCNHQLFRAMHQRYCEMCGRRVKWDA